MKAKLYVCIILTALIAVFTISGCNKAPEHEPVSTFDEATVTDVVESTIADITTTTTVTTTVALTETTAAETILASTEPTTKAEEITEAVEVNQTSDKVTISNTDKTENNAPVNTQKPNNTSNNNNVSGNTTNNTSTNKSSICFDKEQITVEIMATERLEIKSQDGGWHIETDNNVDLSLEGYTLVVEGRCSGSCVITATSPTTGETATCNVTILKRDTSGFTDDTPLVFDEMNTAENIQKIVDYCNAYFETLGMTYNEELDPSWAGWYYGRQGGLCVFDTCSLNEEKRLVAGTIKQQVDAILIDYYGCEYTDITYKTVYVVNELDSYYDIVFCYG